jgi:hypothetical protein
MYGRRLHSQLDLLHPDVSRTVRVDQKRQKQGHDAHARAFGVGDLVHVRNYTQGPTWLPGSVTKFNYAGGWKDSP